MRYVYPIVLETEEDDDNWINVIVPDIVGGVTCGQGEENAIYMAKDLIKLMLQEAPNQCYLPKSIEETQKNYPNKKVVMVEVEI